VAREPLLVIGIGQDGPAGLSATSRAHIAQAEVLAGGRRHLAFFPEFPGQRIVIDGDISAVIAQLRESYSQAKTVVLASGDPLYFGIGAALVEALSRTDLAFIPHVSSIQLAFARICEPWHDAQVESLHGRPLESLLPAIADRPRKLALFTDGRNHPARIAEFLAGHGYGEGTTFWVAEELGGPAERITSWTAETIRGQEFSALNVLIVLRTEAPPEDRVANLPLLGIPDDAIAHAGLRRGMITKREVRLVALAALELRPGDVLWDIGAGSGSVSLEAARLSTALRVFAVEHSEEAFNILQANLCRFGLPNIDALRGEAPDVFDQLPDPAAVFIGGSGGRLAEIIARATLRLTRGGRMVMNCITVENFTQGWNSFRDARLDPSVTTVQLTRTRPLADLHAFEPDSPIYVLRGTKP
jgi:precorrin-6B C5,15-methyltransferase / cobalt-precorrin-6B C5,C15-methyltransferase